MKTITFKVKQARRFSDPVLEGVERHIFLVAAHEIPTDLPFDPNPRQQQIDKGIWKDIEAHLLNEEGTPNTFHLKSKGITLLARAVERKDDDTYLVRFDDGHGVVDGGHTYRLLQKNLPVLSENLDGEDPIRQHVKFEVLTGIRDPDLVTEIAGGLNTAIQVQKISLENLRGKFDWVVQELHGQPYLDGIAFREGEDKEYDIRDILVLMDLFNVFAFPTTSSEHPTRAYLNKGDVLDAYLADPDQFQKLRPLLKDILMLNDTFSSEAHEMYNQAGQAAGEPKKGGNLVFVESRKRGPEYHFMFTGTSGKFRLSKGALMPILAAFRWMVDVDPKTGMAKWRGGLSGVLRVWKTTAGELMKRTQQTSISVGRQANAIGRNGQHWAQLFDYIARSEMQLNRGSK